MINIVDCTVKDPDDCNFPPRPSNNAVFAMQSACPSFYTSQVLKYSIGKLIHEMITTGVLKSSSIDYNMVMKFHQAVITMQDNLPLPAHPVHPDTTWDIRYPNLPKQRLHNLIMITGCLVAVHRPHATSHLTSREVAIDASLKNLEAQQRLFELLGDHQHRIHTLIFHTIDKSIFLTTMVIKHGAKGSAANGKYFGGLPIQEIRTALHQAATRLARIKKRSNVAEVGEHVVWHCHELVQSYQQKNQHQEGYKPLIFNVPFESDDMIAQVNASAQSPSLTQTSTCVSPIPTPSSNCEHYSRKFKLADHSHNVISPNMPEFPSNLLPYESTAMAQPNVVFAFPDAGFDDFWSGANFNTSAWLEETGVMEDSFFVPDWEVE